ncbi:hypothetical protein DL95DRAFT_389487, partial [Leptodontidium sp. 2 PMI_412]
MGSRKITSSPASASARQDSVSPAEGREDTRKSFKCGGCGKGYRNTSGLDYHHSHSEGACSKADDDIMPRTFQCEKCKKVYSVYQSLHYHLKHSDCNTTPQPLASSMNPTACNSCSRNFKNMFAFYAHKCVKSKAPDQTITARETALA